MDPLSPGFRVVCEAAPGGARVGRLETPHGALETPAFLPVGTYGAVRGLAPDELSAVGVQGVLANTYHLHLRPGEETVAALGGLHGFMRWSGPILTDSGGFQIYSLDHLCERSEASACGGCDQAGTDAPKNCRNQAPISARAAAPEITMSTASNDVWI